MDSQNITKIRAAFSREGEEVTIRGWIHRKRIQGSLIFLVIRDSTNIMQCTLKKERISERDWKQAEHILIESSVLAKGVVKKDTRAPGGFEMQATEFEALHSAEPFPIARDNSPEFLLDIRHLSIRSREITAAMKVKSTVFEAAREFFKEQGFWEVTPPIIVSGATEGGSSLFDFNYFGKKAFLSQSAQLYLEALIYSLEKVYAITPSFRAEKSRTLRHLAEYWHIEPEAAFCNFEQNLQLQEEFVSFVCQKVARERKTELEIFARKPEELEKIQPPFQRMTYTKALEFLKGKGSALEWGDDFGTEEERMLTAELEKPLFVTHYPKKIKAFYMKEDPEDSRVVLNNDCLAPEGFGEIIGGSQREDDAEKLVSRLREEGYDPKNYEWYLDLRRYGSVPHSGFGLGAERLVRWICKLEHIRDATPFPRVMNRSYP